MSLINKKIKDRFTSSLSDSFIFHLPSSVPTHVQIRILPKLVIGMRAFLVVDLIDFGLSQVVCYAVGGRHILHMVCQVTVAAYNAIFGQTGPKVGSFDAGYGSSIMSRLVGHKKTGEMWFMMRFYTASEAEEMGLINTVVPLEKLEKETMKWCREILRNSPTAIRVLKAALNAVDVGHAGLQVPPSTNLLSLILF
ncbi:unnamed protein product [Arabidopsis arenosa]|uniref:Uncharacterized protein n=1 Tax=Arabidopsis arenosa TaxID=38785 RepID=A0A8S2B310_ARAAE|nr:unnamed protein product [Arabidopsis arenosa]